MPMNAERLLALYEKSAEAEDAIPRLRRFVLDLAVRGKLVEQDPSDEPAAELLKRISKEKARLVKAGEIRKPRDLDDGDEVTPSFDLPQSWRWCRLDTVGAIIGGGTPSATDSSNFAEPGEGFPWLTPADLGGFKGLFISRGARDLTEKGLASSSATPMPAGSVLFTSRAPIGYVAIAANPISTNQGFKSIVPYVAECSAFIALAMRTFAPEIDAKASGTTFKEVSGKIVAAVPFPLPPLAEQQRIVAKVDELMALCDRLQAARAGREAVRDRLTAATLTRLTAPETDAETFPTHARFALSTLPALTTRPDQIKTLRQTILNLAVRGKLVEQDVGDEPASVLLERIAAETTRRATAGEFRLPKDGTALDDESSPFLLPANWQWTQIARLGALNPRNSAKDDQMAAFVPMPMIATEFGVQNGHEIRKWAEIKRGYTHFAEGDVGLAKITPCFENGKSTIFKGLTGGIGAGTTELHILRPVLVLPEYVLLVLKSPYFIETGIPKMTGTAGQKRVSSEYFAYSPFPLPPLAEQHRIVSKVEELMSLCDHLERVLKDADTTRARLLDATLREALAGRSNRD